MPEASVDEYYLAPPGEHHVGAPWQTLPVKPVSIPCPVNQAPNDEFRFRILALDTRHALTALSRCQTVQGDPPRQAARSIVTFRE